MARLIVVEVTAEAGRYNSEIRRMEETNKRLYAGAATGAQQQANAFRIWETSLVGINRLLGAVGISLSAIAGVRFLDNISAFAEQLNAVSKRSRIAVEDLHALERVVKAEEASFEELSTGLVFLQRALAKASDATSEEAKMLKILGVTSREPIEALYQLSDAMRDNLDENNRLFAARVLLGRSSINLVNALALGGDELRRQVATQKELGVFTSEFAKQVDEARDKWQLFKDLLSVKIGQPVIESLIEIAKRIRNVVSASSGLNLALDVEQLESKLRAAEAMKSRGLAHTDVEDIKRQLQAARERLADAMAGGRISDPGQPHTAGPLEEPKKLDLAALTKTNDAAKAAAELANKQREALARLTGEQLKAAESAAELARSQGSLTVDVRAAAVAVIEHERASALLAAQHDKTLTPAIRAAINAVYDSKIAQFDASEAERERKDRLEILKREIAAAAEIESDLAAALAASAQDRETLRQRELQEIGVKKQLIELEADHLAIIGKTREADALRLQAQIQNLERLKEIESATDPDTRIRDAQIRNTQTQLERIGSITVDIGRAVADTMADIAEGLATGTLKGFDIVKAAGSSMLRLVTDIFRQTLQQKLSFELNLFNNLRTLPGQATNALTAGGGNQGIFQTLLFGAGGGGGFPQPPLIGGGIQGPVTGPITLPGGGGGGLLGGLMTLLTTQTTAGGWLPGGVSIGGLGGAGLAGWGFGQLVGLNRGGSIGSSVGSVLGSLAGATTAGAGITGAIGGWLGGTTIGATLGTSIVGALAGMVIPVIGALIGIIIGQVLGNQKPNPTAVIGAQFGGVGFNKLESIFEPGTLTVGVRRNTDLSRKAAESVATSAQTILGDMAAVWTNVLNFLPDFVADDVIPALDETNRRLNANFARLKFSEGGSRNIQEELEALQLHGNIGFLDAFLPAIGAGFNAALQRIGVDVAPSISGGFGQMGPPVGQEGWDKLIAAMQSVGQTVGALTSIPGINQLLTPTDRTSIASSFQHVFGLSDPNNFTAQAELLTQRLQPITDFLQQAMAQSTDLFGRGLIAAMEALDESGAVTAFNQVLNTGIKDAVFGGITESFLATAQFSDLLAPLQQAIRESVQHSMETGTFDGAAGVGAAVAAILERAKLLEPLATDLQAYGEAIKKMLGFQTEETLSVALNASTDVFGRGLIAAMEAATQSEARLAFMNTLGTGVKDTVFRGLTEAFIASAQFNELLEPILDQIRDFTQRAIETGLPPDIEAFRSAILPGIEGIVGRAELLQDLIAALQELGFEIRDKLGLTEESQPATIIQGPVHITVTSNNAQQFMSDLNRLLSSRLPPT